MLSVIIPAFNESDNLKKNIPKLVKYLNSKKMKYEIIVSEDGSTDDSRDVLNKFSKIYGIRYVHYEKRLGKGAAIKKAGKMAKYEKVIFIDADIPINLDSIITLSDELEINDVVIGSRYIEGSKTTRTFKRLFLSRVYHLLVKIMFPELKLNDIQCGFKGFRKGVFVSINKETKMDEWSWDLEFLVLANKKGLKIKEVPIEWREGEKTKLNVLENTFFKILDLLVIRFRTIF